MTTTSQTTPTYGERQRLDRAAEHYLRTCYQHRTAVRASEFALFLGVSVVHLSRTVREITGIRLRQYLWTRQLEYAEKLLRETSLTIDEVAIKAGFGTPRTFYRRFRESYGISPGEFVRLRNVSRSKT